MTDKKGNGECIQVCVRCRPMNTKEKNENRGHIINMFTDDNQVLIKQPNSTEPKSFTFDAVYDENTIQKNFYDESCFSLVESVLEGFNGTIFAYGQTGCGKSFTMQGPPGIADLKGVIPNAITHIFEAITASKDVQYLVRCCYLEIYNEEIKDLLIDPKIKQTCDIKEHPDKGVYVKGLSEEVVENELDLQALLDKGQTNRTVAATAMNAESSRSHSIFSIVVEASFTDKESGKENLRAGKLNLVDLAGSERQKKTGASGALLREGAKINLSLSALGNVISALADGKGSHIPYRDSKLTRLLQDSLGGNTKTLMVAAISPADYNYDETLSTLRYANRAKNIKNKPRINEDPKDTMLREYKEEIEKLRQALLDAQNNNSSSSNTGNNNTINNNDNSNMIDFAALAGNNNNNNNDNNQEINNDVKINEMNAALEEERKAREDMALKLQQMQARFLGMNIDSNIVDNNVNNIDSTNEDAIAKATAIAAKREQERLEAERLHWERKQKAQKKKELKAKSELEKAEKEKAAMKDELAELRAMINNNSNDSHNQELNQAEQQTHNNLTNSGLLPEGATIITDQKLRAIKRKYDRKIKDLTLTIEDMKEEFYFEKEHLLESMREESKNTRLFELLCRAILSEKEFKRAVEKSRWDEENDDWYIPALKRKGLPSEAITGNNIALSNHNFPKGSISPRGSPRGSSSTSGGLLPDIRGKKSGHDNTMIVNQSLPNMPTAKNQSMNMTMNLATINMSDNMHGKKTKSKKNKLPNIGIGGSSNTNNNKIGNNIKFNEHFDEDDDYDDMIYNDDTYDNDIDDEFSAPSSSTIATAHTNGNNDLKYIPILPDEAGTNETAGPISDWDFNNGENNTNINHMNTRLRLGEDDIVNINEDNNENYSNMQQVKKEKKKKKKKEKREKENLDNIYNEYNNGSNYNDYSDDYNNDDNNSMPTRRTRVKQSKQKDGSYSPRSNVSSLPALV